MVHFWIAQQSIFDNLGMFITSVFWIIHILHCLGSHAQAIHHFLLMYKGDRHVALTAQSAVNATWRVDHFSPGTFLERRILENATATIAYRQGKCPESMFQDGFALAFECWSHCPGYLFCMYSSRKQSYFWGSWRYFGEMC